MWIVGRVLVQVAFARWINEQGTAPNRDVSIRALTRSLVETLFSWLWKLDQLAETVQFPSQARTLRLEEEKSTSPTRSPWADLCLL